MQASRRLFACSRAQSKGGFVKVVTLTLNPAFDVHCAIDNLIPLKENFATITSKQAGGKGLNLSRALANNGVRNTALIVVGKANADAFRESATFPLVDCEYVEVDGNVRENYTLHHKNGKETRISFDGFTCPDGVVKVIADKLNRLNGGDVVALTGSISKGIDKNKVIKLLKKLQVNGVKIIIDSRSFSVDDIRNIKPWFIKPNEQEIEDYVGYKVLSFEQAVSASKKLYDLGVKNAMVSLGSDGAVITDQTGIRRIIPPSVNVKSTIGAGDSLIAGFIYGYVNGLSFNETLKTAIAFGSGACTTEGTNPPDSKVIEEIKKQVKIITY